MLACGKMVRNVATHGSCSSWCKDYYGLEHFACHFCISMAGHPWPLPKINVLPEQQWQSVVEYSKNQDLHACKTLNINLGVYFCILVILQKVLKKSLPVNKAVVFMLNQENQIVGQITKLCKGFYPDDTRPHMYISSDIQAYCRKRQLLLVLESRESRFLKTLYQKCFRSRRVSVELGRKKLLLVYFQQGY